jgi:hypothetical protein
MLNIVEQDSQDSCDKMSEYKDVKTMPEEEFQSIDFKKV